MIKRELDKLREAELRARSIHRMLDTEPYREPRISLSIHEAIHHAAQLEAYLADAADTAEAELWRGNSRTKE